MNKWQAAWRSNVPLSAMDFFAVSVATNIPMAGRKKAHF